MLRAYRLLMLSLAAWALAGCGMASQERAATAPTTTPAASAPAPDAAKFQRDRQAILAMAGDYEVGFDFQETVAFVNGYELKPRYQTGGFESVRVIADEGDFISLQHILVASGDQPFAIKHWRQDWVYEPASVLVYVGGNAWRQRPVPAAQARGKWAQIVYQVDDSPRYGAVAAWSHAGGVSSWSPPREWRPLPRRDATKRDDYHSIDAINRHVITPWGWVHEQDNAKLVLDGTPQMLVREIGVNTYRRSSAYEVAVADAYWDATQDYWAGVRDQWAALEHSHAAFGLTIQGEPEELYQQILALAGDVADGAKPQAAAIAEARDIIAQYTRADIGTLAARLSD